MDFIGSTLMLLEDAGLRLNRPDFTKIELYEDGKRCEKGDMSCRLGRRVHIEHNPKAKFLLIFSMFDFYIDSKYPELEGKSYSHKYKKLPDENDFDLIIKELFRIAKVIRNSLVHTPSKFEFQQGRLNINYSFNNVDFSFKIPVDSLTDVYTLIIMFIERRNNETEYFIRIARYMYKNIINDIEEFSDEFKHKLRLANGLLTLVPYQRFRVLKTKFEVNEGVLKITESKNIKNHIKSHQSYDFCVELGEDVYIIPLEELDDDFSISINELTPWKQ
ncbi:hypothetical protein [Pectobacterium versatile]|uniref:hypothetical protein n=1 Tax=Pectobacterium versatile TaxID=2488639 RepID=UPI00386F7D40